MRKMHSGLFNGNTANGHQANAVLSKLLSGSFAPCQKSSFTETHIFSTYFIGYNWNLVITVVTATACGEYIQQLLFVCKSHEPQTHKHTFTQGFLSAVIDEKEGTTSRKHGMYLKGTSWGKWSKKEKLTTSLNLC